MNERDRNNAIRQRISEAGLNPEPIRDRHLKYLISMAHLNAVDYHQKIVDDYRETTEPKWEDFENKCVHLGTDSL